MMKRRMWVAAVALLVQAGWMAAQVPVAATYANPMDLPYRFRPDAPSRREAADPTMVVFKGEYWLFASKSGGYWHSKDLLHWQFVVPEGLPLEDYAPTVVEMHGKLYFTAAGSKGIWSTSDPWKGVWTKVADALNYNDPDLFVDDDGRLYMYSGCSSKTPLKVTELDPEHGFKVIREQDIEESRDTLHRGYEVAGDRNELPGSGVWIEGAWMTKYKGKYYLQYATPRTMDKTYADAVLVGDSPMGPFHAPAQNPISYKPSGFIAGAGHGSTFMDLHGQWWHIATMTISVRHNFERRLGLFPVSFLDDGSMAADTYLGDYPHRMGGDRGLAGWMLLSLNKPATASSSLEGHAPSMAVDEDVRDWWAAASGNAGEWLQVDLGRVQKVMAVQVNHADEGSTALGISGKPYLYRVEGSTDGKNWRMLVDRGQQGREAPHEYVQLERSADVRYVRITNVRTPNGAKFSLSGLRIFGVGAGSKPAKAEGVQAVRSAKEPADGRVAEVSWKPAAGAEFYIVHWGIARDRMVFNDQVYGRESVEIRSLMTGIRYYFTVDAVNAAGITTGTEIVSLQP
jgi:hypothetical protein